jgi:hypothetical protein
LWWRARGESGMHSGTAWVVLTMIIAQPSPQQSPRRAGFNGGSTQQAAIASKLTAGEVLSADSGQGKGHTNRHAGGCQQDRQTACHDVILRQLLYVLYCTAGVFCRQSREKRVEHETDYGILFAGSVQLTGNLGWRALLLQLPTAPPRADIST